MLDMWNSRYDSAEYIYGEEPNAFFKSFIDGEIPGKILLAAEGEGRNSVYAAKKGWQCFAFDYSSKAMEKALLLAKKANVKIHYVIQDYENMQIENDYYDVVALIFAHIRSNIRNKVHQKIIECLKPGGKIVLQSFSKKQIHFESGGPKDINMLYSIDELTSDFKKLDILMINEKNINLNEGKYHFGEASVVEFIAQKVSNE